MKLRFILGNEDSIKNFSLLLTFFGKHDDRIVLIFSKDRVTFLTQDSKLWADIEIKKLTDLYLIQGDDFKDENYNFIYMDIKSSTSAIGFESFSRGNAAKLDIALRKESFPFLKLSGKMGKSKLDVEIPTVVIPRERWSMFNLPRNPKYEIKYKLPRYTILRKYIDIYRTFYYLRFSIREQNLVFEAICDINSRVTTVFLDIKAKNSQGILYDGENVDVLLEVKRLSTFLHSIAYLNAKRDFHIKCCSVRNAFVHFSVSCLNNTVDLNFVLPHNERDSNEMDDHK